MMDVSEQRLSASDMEGILEFPCGIQRLDNGHTLIADAGSEAGTGSELLEVNPVGDIVRRWNDKLRFLHGVKALTDGTVVLADTTNNRILGVRPDNTLAFTSEDWDNGSGRLSNRSRLSYPNNIHPMADGLFMVTDRNNNRFAVVDRFGQAIRTGFPNLKHPHNCEPLPNGGVIVANSDENSVDEFDANGELVWRYDTDLNWPRDANRLPNGHTLIADSKNSRILEVNREKEIVWSWQADYFANVYEAHRLANGNTLVSDQQRQQALEIAPDGEIVWSFRNYKREFPVYDRLINGSFKRWEDNAMPEGWHLGVRFSEGGGRLTSRQDARGKRIPGLAYDRAGGLYLQQTVKVHPGMFYTLAGQLGVEDLDGTACLQVAFADEHSALLCDASRSPCGQSFSGNAEMTQDSLEVEAPPRAALANVRIFVSGKGQVFFDQIRFFA